MAHRIAVAAIALLLALTVPAFAGETPPFRTQYQITVDGAKTLHASLTIVHAKQCGAQSTFRQYLLEDHLGGNRVVFVGEVTDSIAHGRRTISKKVIADRQTFESGVPVNTVTVLVHNENVPVASQDLNPTDELRHMLTALSQKGVELGDDTKPLLVVRQLPNGIPQLTLLEGGGPTIRFTLIASQVDASPKCK